MLAISLPQWFTPIKLAIKVVINVHQMYMGTCAQYIKVLLGFGKVNFWPSRALNMIHFHLSDTLTF